MKSRLYGQCSTLLILLALTLFFLNISYTNKHLIFRQSYVTFQFPDTTPTNSPTNLSHIVFGLIGSEKAWHHRKAYIESWWRANLTRGLLFLDEGPSEKLLPWPETSPPYRVSDDLTRILNKSDIRAQRMVHGIMEVVREMEGEDDHQEFRWLVMGDDDSVFFVDNIVNVVSKYDHSKYYYLGGHSENIVSNYQFSFNQAFGGGGIMLSYPLAKALGRDMENCLKRYLVLNSADNTTRACIADIGATLSPQKGNHQIDLHGDISGLLSAHPLSPLISLHHLDKVEPIFPAKDRLNSTRHLMVAAKADQSRLLQQTICYHRRKKWSFSISWGYSAQIYERIMPRSYLQIPIETFKPWMKTSKALAYMFNTRRPSNDPCKAPHAFFFESVDKTSDDEIVTRYSRSWPRKLLPCSSTPNTSADFIQRIQVFSSPINRYDQMDRCECCDIIRMDNTEANIRFRECLADEIIA